MDSSGNGWYRNDSFTVIGLTLMLTAAFVFFRKSLLEIKILGTCNHMKREKQNAFLFSIFKRIQRWKYETKSCFGRYFLIWIRYFLYPTISNWLATRAHYSEISSYDKKIKALQKKEVERREKEAAEYNKQVQTSAKTFTDPFSEKVIIKRMLMR